MNMFSQAHLVIALILLCSVGVLPASYINGTCRKGQYRHKAVESSYDAECRPCPAGTFNDHDFNDEVSCRDCTDLTPEHMRNRHLVREHNCIRTSDTKYECQDGYENIDRFEPHPPAIPNCTKSRQEKDHLADASTTARAPAQVSMWEPTHPSLKESTRYEYVEGEVHLQNSTHGTTHTTATHTQTTDVVSNIVLPVVLSFVALIVGIIFVICCCKRKGRAGGTDPEEAVAMHTT